MMMYDNASVCVRGSCRRPDVPHIHTRRATQLQGWAEQEHGQPGPTAYEAGLAQAVRGLGELIAHLREGVDDDAWNTAAVTNNVITTASED